MTNITDEEYRLYMPDWKAMPRHVFCALGNVDEAEGIIAEMDDFETTHNSSHGPTWMRYHYGHDDKASGMHVASFNVPRSSRSANYTRDHQAERLAYNYMRPIGISVMRKPPTPGTFYGLPIGSTLVQKETNTRWLLIDKHEKTDKGLTLALASDPTNIMHSVNPNLGIRRCLKRFNYFDVRRSGTGGWRDCIDIQMPVNEAHVQRCLTLGKLAAKHDYYDTIPAYLKSVCYSFNGFVPKDDTDVDEWAALETMCS